MQDLLAVNFQNISLVILPDPRCGRDDFSHTHSSIAVGPHFSDQSYARVRSTSLFDQSRGTTVVNLLELT